jgi:hypothetical protein
MARAEDGVSMSRKSRAAGLVRMVGFDDSSPSEKREKYVERWIETVALGRRPKPGESKVTGGPEKPTTPNDSSE